MIQVFSAPRRLEISIRHLIGAGQSYYSSQRVPSARFLGFAGMVYFRKPNNYRLICIMGDYFIHVCIMLFQCACFYSTLQSVLHFPLIIMKK